MNAFIQQWCFKLIRDSKDFHIVTEANFFIIKCCSLELSINQRILWKYYHSFRQHNCFQQCQLLKKILLEQQNSILEWFLRDHVTLTDQSQFSVKICFKNI